MTDGERSDVLSAKLDALRELVDERDHRYEDRFTAMDEKTSLALTSSKEAVAKAEIATEKRFDSVNEFRNQLKDQAGTFMARPEANALFRALEEKIESIKSGSVVTSRWTMDKVLMLTVALIGWVLLLWRR